MSRKLFFERNDLLFYIAYIVYFVTKYIENTTFNIILIKEVAFLLKNASYALCVFIVVLILTKRPHIPLKIILIHAFIWVLIMYQVLVNNGKSVFVVFLFSYAFAGRDFKTFIKVNYWLSLLCFIHTIVSSFAGITTNVCIRAEKFGEVWYRESWGFDYPGKLMMMIIPIILMYYYLNIDELVKVKAVYKSVVWIVILGVFFAISMTIMPAFECLVFIAFVLFVRNAERWKGFYWIAPISAILTIVLVYLQIAAVPAVKKFDEITNFRFSFGEDAFLEYGISMLGNGFQNINDGTNYLILDSEYMFFYVSNGVIYTIVVVMLLASTIKWAYEKRDYMLMWILGFYALHAMFNNGIYNLLMNPFMIIVVRAMNEQYSKNILSSKISSLLKRRECKNNI